jgi:citrate synthase
MQYYGLTQEDYYTVVFAVSRSIGCLAQLTLSRRMGLPIERVKSVDMKWLDNKLK